MKRYLSLQAFLFAIVMAGCTSTAKPEDPAQWSPGQVSGWFNEKAWLGQTNLVPDSSIDRKAFAIQYHRNRERWDKAFAFLRKGNFADLPLGNHELDGKNVFVKITEYRTKDRDSILYESHNVYSDIHTVISGAEFIGHADLLTTGQKTPYDSAKDIQFYHVATGKDLLAEPGTFFILFPHDAHRQGIKVGDYATVRKMVIKVKN